MKLIFVLPLLVVGAAPCLAQTANTTSGSCSPIVTGNDGTVTIECKGMSDQLQGQLVDILNRILKNQIDPQLVMSKLDEISKGVGSLKERSVDAERGVISIYDFNGAKREGVAGRMSLTVGAETQVFQEMQKLFSQKEWPSLLALCDKQISETPKWLTPHLYLALAYGNLGQNEKAKEKLEYVAQRAGNDPAYKLAGELLAKLNAAR
jgi:hypothetical protein